MPLEMYRGECFCPTCGHLLALSHQNEEVEPPTGRPYIGRSNFLQCSNSGCPAQAKRILLPVISVGRVRK